MSGTPSYADLDAVLAKVEARLTARQVHALYLGALTSTSPDFGPQKLLNGILGDAPKIANQEEANATLPIVLGYWNTLLSERKARGGVELAPKKLGPKPTRTALETFAKTRENELEWYARGLGATGHPSDLGERGKRLIESLAEGQVIFRSNALVLGQKSEAESKELEKIRGSLLELEDMMEKTMSELITHSEQIRRESSDEPPVALPAANVAKVGRNDMCSCGSGKKFKKCHGR